MTAPTLDPVEERALQNLQTTIAAISTTSLVASFYTDVKIVVDDRDPRENIAMPCAVLHHVGTDHEWGPIGLYDSVSHVDVYLVIHRTKFWRRDLLRFAADVRRALMVDAHRGNVSGQANVFDTHVVNTALDPEAEGKNTAMARLAVQFQFRDSIDDLTQSA